MKAIEWAIALLLGSVSLLFISLNIVVLIWGYKISQSLLHCDHIQKLSIDEQYELHDNLESVVRNNSTKVI